MVVQIKNNQIKKFKIYNNFCNRTILWLDSHTLYLDSVVDRHYNGRFQFIKKILFDEGSTVSKTSFPVSVIIAVPRKHRQAAPFTVLEYLEHCSRTVCNGVHTLF